MELFNKLRLYRFESKMSQQEVADVVGISKSKYWRMEKGEILPDVEELDKLLKLFNITYQEMCDTDFPVVHTIKYPPELLENLQNVMKENSRITEDWKENQTRYHNLKNALHPLLDIRNEALDFPDLDYSSVPLNQTTKTVNLDMNGEFLIGQAIKLQGKLIKALV